MKISLLRLPNSVKSWHPELADREPWGCFALALLLLTVPFPLLAAAAMAAIIHECCHVLSVKLLGGEVRRFSLTLGGAVLDVAGLTSAQEAIAASAGPVGSLLLLLGIHRFPMLALCGLVQGCFNLLPIFPLDGGRILVCVMQSVGLGVKAEKISRVVAWGTLGVLSALFLWLRMPLAIFFLLPLLPKK